MISLISRIRSSIPTYIQETYPQFVNFLITYYEYLETEGVVSELIKFEENIFPTKLFDFLNIEEINLNDISGVKKIPF